MHYRFWGLLDSCLAANDEARGGDIDLLIELPFLIEDIERKTMQLIARLQLGIGDQPLMCW
jgi:hypothetical protein